MFVKSISASQKTSEFSINSFDFETLQLLNYRGDVVFETSSIDSDNSELTLENQVYVGAAKIDGTVDVPEGQDAGVIEVVVGQDRGATWSLTIIASPDDEELGCQFGLPPTTLALFSRLLPIPVKSVCKSCTDLPEDIEI